MGWLKSVAKIITIAAPAVRAVWDALKGKKEDAKKRVEKVADKSNEIRKKRNERQK